MTSLLIFTPTHENGPDPRCVESVSQQTYTDHTHEVSWLTDPLPGRNFANVVRQYQRAWQMALEGGYEALLTVEHDMILPSHAAETMLATDAPVVYGLYMLRHGTPTLNAWRYEGNRNMGMSLSLYPKEVREARARGWARVSGVGWGCTLIRREVLERMAVRGSEHDAGDSAFATDCIRADIKLIARFDVECGHIKPDGLVLWPHELGGGIVARVYAMQNVVANANGQTLAIKQGHYYSLPLDVAAELSRAGYVRITNDDESQSVDEDIATRETAVDVMTTKRAKGRTKSAS